MTRLINWLQLPQKCKELKIKQIETWNLTHLFQQFDFLIVITLSYHITKTYFIQ